MRDPHKDVEHGGGGRYTVVDPPSRLAFTWVWDDDPHETLIEIEFEETGEGTEVRFTHNGLLNEERSCATTSTAGTSASTTSARRSTGRGPAERPGGDANLLPPAGRLKYSARPGERAAWGSRGFGERKQA